jgi:hypothetical protein
MGTDDGQVLDDGGPARFADLTEPAGGWGRPIAATVEAAAELLAAPLGAVRAAAERVEPYRHADGSGRWSLRLLERELGRGRGGPGTGPATGTSTDRPGRPAPGGFDGPPDPGRPAHRATDAGRRSTDQRAAEPAAMGRMVVPSPASLPLVAGPRGPAGVTFTPG